MPDERQKNGGQKDEKTVIRSLSIFLSLQYSLSKRGTHRKINRCPNNQAQLQARSFFTFSVVDEATSPCFFVFCHGLVASSTTLDPNS
ncbi:hypothetical protein Pla52o_42390 [Novipirellula galeiformis]|uniref:Uncharacterized protein n=1 Tax=Novipirellula galeiformis TaxID=2528004 RepID=A0A5C6CAU0_9BACT|nr:hypothetical protein Pla52o_42390 [Novipirellula galeiformis]